MRLIFIYGEPAVGKLTVARALAQQTGLPLFHNHLIVDAVLAVFPFGSEEFVRLREQFWLETIEAAAQSGRSLIFTFNPESSVAPDLPQRIAERVRVAGGQVVFVALTAPAETLEQRLVAASRAEFGKLRSLELFRQLKADFASCMAAMPEADVTIDTSETTPEAAAAMIVKAADRLSKP